ncbi:hypothetical protein DPX16_17015 [Anabarilius grahami]|uniref:Uncharacterized protein n=1 Tax=Anabarilius grahami TaxID=495550 RepID=A0A3N0YAT2_ANAGA|nr:hypothetical protein DPX16_17015 [Anabarilius grahami]
MTRRLGIETAHRHSRRTGEHGGSWRQNLTTRFKKANGDIRYSTAERERERERTGEQASEERETEREKGKASDREKKGQRDTECMRARQSNEIHRSRLPPVPPSCFKLQQQKPASFVSIKRSLRGSGVMSENDWEDKLIAVWIDDTVAAGESHAAKMMIVSNGVQPYIVQTGVDTDEETREEVTTFRMKLDVWLVDKFM